MSRLLSEAEHRATGLLSDHRDALDAVIAALLDKETISGDDLADIVHRAQGVAVGGNSRSVRRHSSRPEGKT